LPYYLILVLGVIDCIPIPIAVLVIDDLGETDSEIFIEIPTDSILLWMSISFNETQ